MLYLVSIKLIFILSLSYLETTLHELAVQYANYLFSLNCIFGLPYLK